jgi:photosynthetic reaction center H subunit
MYANPHIDWAFVAIISFFGLFTLLIFYLRREDRREGYPLEDESGRLEPQGGVLFTAQPKTFLLFEGGTYTAPNGSRDQRPIAARPASRSPGSPLIPTGNPMVDGVGPAAYAQRARTPLLDVHGRPRILPMRVATNFHVSPGDSDPRGLRVMGADRVIAGRVSDIWVDTAEGMVRYLQVSLDANGGEVLLPITMCLVDAPRQVTVDAIAGRQFASVPRLSNPDSVTLDEEERVCAYFGGGFLYASPERSEPVL